MEEKEVSDTVFKSIAIHQNLVVSVKTEDYPKLTGKLHLELAKKFKKTCILTMAEPFSEILAELEEKGIDASKFCAIDCTPEKDNPKDSAECMNISSPADLTDMWIAVQKMRDIHELDLIVLENISSLLVYNKDVVVLRFLHSFIARLRTTKTKAILLMIEGNKRFTDDLALFADEIIQF